MNIRVIKTYLNWTFDSEGKSGCIPGGGTDVTALHTAQHTEVAPTG